MGKLLGGTMLATAFAVVVAALVPQLAAADTITKLDGTAGCLADAASSLPAGTCTTAKGIDDATDIAISPDGKFAYAAATSSNSIAIFSRDGDSGELTQLAGNAGCIAAREAPIAGCAQGNGLEGPSALAMSPDGKNVYVTTFTLDPGAQPTPEIEGTLLTFTRNASSGALTQNSCVVGGVPPSGSPTPVPIPVSAPSGCTMATFSNAAAVPLGTASDVEVSPDGNSVVTSSFLPGAVINWSRNASTGAVTPSQCLGNNHSIFPTDGSLTDVCTGATGAQVKGLGYPLDVEFAPDGSKVYAAALGLEQDETTIEIIPGVPVQAVPAADEPGSIALFNRAGNGSLSQAASPAGCIDDTRDPVLPDTSCSHRTALLNPYRVNVSPDSKNVYVGTLNVFPPAGIAGPGPGELSQFNADLTQLNPPCLQQLGLPAGGLEATPGCSLTTFGLILPSDIAFSSDGASAFVTSLFHSVGSYTRAASGALTQNPPKNGCSIDPRNLLPGTEVLGQICQNAVPLNAPTSIQLSPDDQNAYVTSGGFLTGNPNFGPALASAGIESDDAITIFGPTPATPPPPPPPPPPGPVPTCNLEKATIYVDEPTGDVTKLTGTKGDDVIVGTDGVDKINGPRRQRHDLRPRRQRQDRRRQGPGCRHRRRRRRQGQDQGPRRRRSAVRRQGQGQAHGWLRRGQAQRRPRQGQAERRPRQGRLQEQEGQAEELLRTAVLPAATAPLALLLLALLAAAIFVVGGGGGSAQAGIKAEQPPQPKPGPGGSDSSHKGVRVSSGGEGADAWFAFEPTGPRLKKAPLAIVMHGYGEFEGYSQMEAFIDHTVRKGTVVIYPRWQTGIATPCPGPVDIEPCIDSAVAGINGALDSPVREARQAGPAAARQDQLLRLLLRRHRHREHDQPLAVARAAEAPRDLPRRSSRRRADRAGRARPRR